VTTKAIQARLPIGEAKALERLAKANERSVAAELRVAVKRHLARKPVTS